MACGDGATRTDTHIYIGMVMDQRHILFHPT